VIIHRKRLIATLLVIVVVGSTASISAIRRSILRAAGWVLVINDRVEAADVIVLAYNDDFAGMLEAADLVHSGVATRVAIFADPPDRVDREFIRRGVPYEDTAARAVRELRALGVGGIEQIPQTVHGTEDIARVLPDWSEQQGLRSVLLVSPTDHSRRLRRMLHRAMKGHHARVTVRSARYSVFDPDRWWESHDGIRTEFVEFEKLLLDVVRHPIS
jgi:hypothetical protein